MSSGQRMRARARSFGRIALVALAAAASVTPEARAGGAGSVPAPPLQPTSIGGFRMEGAADVAVVFGDAEDFRRHVDGFFRDDAELSETRRALTLHTRAALGALTAARRGHCPTEELAPHYARAAAAMEHFEQIGSRYQALYRAIQALHRIGDTAALTPDYRWKVNRTAERYRRALDELRELRAAFGSELGRELRYYRCHPPALIARGTDVVAVPVTRPLNPPPKQRRRKGAEPLPAAPRDVTFFVDNRACKADVSVVLDGADLGSVSGGSRGVFHSLAGRHSMCLVVAGSSLTCGQQGTVRHAFVYDGWSITMHCLAP
ncbi:MAG TPA: hypothetical protein VML75_26720 [Kofleriaceae bacterium]|nr:hypothetical protein [Kofleriaceae bacterium]